MTKYMTTKHALKQFCLPPSPKYMFAKNMLHEIDHEQPPPEVSKTVQLLCISFRYCGTSRRKELN
jgi:hypothetical protein